MHERNSAASEKIALLEYELRKAKETIKNLRTEMTRADEDGDEVLQSSAATEESLKPVERRALDYLVNEYLLDNGHKLASLALAETCEQNLDSWEAVGSGRSHAPTLLRIFRNFKHQKPHLFSAKEEQQVCVDASTQTIVELSPVEIATVAASSSQFDSIEEVDRLSDRISEVASSCNLVGMTNVSSVPEIPFTSSPLVFEQLHLQAKDSGKDFAGSYYKIGQK